MFCREQDKQSKPNPASDMGSASLTSAGGEKQREDQSMC